jgi:transcriptional regulator with XRE-family HTH domain
MKYKMGRRPAEGAGHPIDVQIGRKVVARRIELGISPPALAAKLGITPARLQRFENGRASLAASELVALAAALDLPVSAFFEDGDPRQTEREDTAIQEPRSLEIGRSAETEELLRAYQQIRDPESRRMLAKVVEKLAAGYHQVEGRRVPARKRRATSSRSGSGWLN